MNSQELHNLWPEAAPYAQGDDPEDMPALQIFQRPPAARPS